MVVMNELSGDELGKSENVGWLDVIIRAGRPDNGMESQPQACTTANAPCRAESFRQETALAYITNECTVLYCIAYVIGCSSSDRFLHSDFDRVIALNEQSFMS